MHLKQFQSVFDHLIGADLEKTKGLEASASEARGAGARFCADERSRTLVRAAEGGIGGRIDSESGSAQRRCEMKRARVVRD